MEILRGQKRYLIDDSIVTRSVTDVRRVGKVISMILDDGRVIRSHLAMSGLWSSRTSPWSFDYVEARREPGDDRHARVILHTDSDEIVYHDQRLFGRISVGSADWLSSPGMGWEWIDTLCGIMSIPTDAQFIELVRSQGETPVRSFLCDQSKIPGIGNIYSAESLYSSGIDPRTRCSDLDDTASRLLFERARLVLSEAIERKLDYSPLCVYRRKSCPLSHPVSSIKMDGRTVYLCETCQGR